MLKCSRKNSDQEWSVANQFIQSTGCSLLGLKLLQEKKRKIQVTGSALDELSHVRTFPLCHHPSWLLLTPGAKNVFLFYTAYAINSSLQGSIGPVLHVQTDCNRAVKKES